METVGAPKCMDVTGNLAVNWKKWRQGFELYMVASGANTKEEPIKVALLLHLVGEDAVQIYNTLDMTTAERASYSTTMEKMQNYFVPKTNISVESYKFNVRVQGPSETFDNFVADLRKLSASCEFGSLRDRLIMDKIVQGVYDQQLKTSLLREQSLTLEKAINMGRAAEQTKDQMKTMNSEVEINAVQRNKNPSKYQPNKASTLGKKKGGENKAATTQKTENSDYKKSCGRCGYEHGKVCPAIGQVCLKCGKKDHFAKMCRIKKVNEVVEEEDIDFHIGSIENESRDNSLDWFEDLEVGLEGKSVKFKIDTGAQVNVLSLEQIKKLGLVEKMSESNVWLRSYTGGRIPVIGKCVIECKNVNKIKKLEFQIIESNNTPILGLKGIKELGILEKMINEIEKAELMASFKDLFEGLGDIKTRQCTIKLKEGTVPKVVPGRKIPFKLEKKVKKELQRMETAQVIQKVDEPTEWVNPIVLVGKPDRDIRICLDPVYLNEAIMREHCKLPTFEEITAHLQGTTVFSTLDANKGFYQIRLDEESSKMTTFSTPYGRYRFLRMPFGISSAPEIFHKTFKAIFEGIEGVQIYIDDILVVGKDKEEHDQRLRQVLERAKENGVKFNKKKCNLEAKEVRFMGHILTKEGIRVDEDRVEAIRRIPTPKTVTELQRFLGMVTYVSRFIPNLSEMSVNLRNICKKDVVWDWSPQCQADFDSLKQALMQAPVLQYFDVNKPIVLSVDSSQEGLGAVLLQDEAPVVYASKSLTDSQRQYAQIEKEMLAIIFGCERFKQYLFGQEIIVESDHKPLEAICKKPLDKCPLRLQRLCIKLKDFGVKVVCKPGNKLFIADTLSRASYDDKDFDLEDETEVQVNMIEEIYNVSEGKLQQIREETEKDQELQELKTVIQKGWPSHRSQVSVLVKSYWGVKEELVSCKGLMFRGQQIVIPKKLRTEMLDKIHYTHLGISKSIARAKDCIFWPMMNKEIEDRVSQCRVCLEFSRSNQKETYTQRKLPTRPWEMVATDMFFVENQAFLLVVDMYSKYPEVMTLKNQTTQTVINALKSIFARHGIPDCVYSDNGTNLVSKEIRELKNTWEFETQTSSPRYPQSNGFIERYVQTVKNLIKKAIADNEDVHLSLLEYRNTPIEQGGLSPAQLLFNRRLKGILPTNTDLLKPTIAKNQLSKLQENQNKQKKYYDKSAKDLKELGIEDRVLVQSGIRNWKHGVIIEVSDNKPKAYKVRLSNGSVLERNRRFLRVDTSKINQTEQMYDNDTTNEEQQTEMENVNDQDELEDRNRINIPNEVNRTPQQSREPQVCTRAGRITKKPTYLKDYETDM